MLGTLLVVLLTSALLTVLLIFLLVPWPFGRASWEKPGMRHVTVEAFLVFIIIAFFSDFLWFGGHGQLFGIFRGIMITVPAIIPAIWAGLRTTPEVEPFEPLFNRCFAYLVEGLQMSLFFFFVCFLSGVIYDAVIEPCAPRSMTMAFAGHILASPPLNGGFCIGLVGATLLFALYGVPLFIAVMTTTGTLKEITLARSH